jgi:uncharacterized protein involved in high-affinity Fe2+ transport
VRPAIPGDQSGGSITAKRAALSRTVQEGNGDVACMAQIEANRQSRLRERFVPYLLEAIRVARKLSQVDRPRLRSGTVMRMVFALKDGEPVTGRNIIPGGAIGAHRLTALRRPDEAVAGQ